MSEEVNLPDCASTTDDRNLGINRVGVRNLRYPIEVLDRTQGHQSTIADISIAVTVPPEQRGTHMSRFIEIIDSTRGNISLETLAEILRRVQRQLETDNAFVEIAFPFFMMRKAPVSGVPSMLDYRCTFRGSLHKNEFDFAMTVNVPVHILCPCSKEISERGAHNQRATVNVTLHASRFVWIEEIVGAVESCASSPLYTLLNRVDEKQVTEQAYDRPRFVEDLARDTVLAVRRIGNYISDIEVTVDSEESIHNHSAYAQLYWSSENEGAIEEAAAEEEAKEEKAKEPLRIQDAAGEEAMQLAFGRWVYHQRKLHGIKQCQLAKMLGLTPSYLSRLEKGGRASDGFLRDFAAVLHLDPVIVSLRAGRVPQSLLDKISREPERFLAMFK